MANLPESQDKNLYTPDPTKRRGIYILPNLFTTASLFAGFYAIVAAMNHEYQTAAIAIFVAMIFDGLDGRVARLINAQSPFGAEYDSLSDMLAFGVTPALVMYNWALQSLAEDGFGKVGWLTAFLYVACVALRLARFNTQVDHSGEAKRYFSGLPCPSAAAFIASLVWVGNIYHVQGMWVSLLALVFTIFVSVMMVSSIPYRSFKDIDLKGKIRFTALVVIVLIAICISISPAHLLLVVFALYVFSGPAVALWNLRGKKTLTKTEPKL